MGCESRLSAGVLAGKLGGLFFCECLEREHGGSNHMAQSILEQRGTLAAIETENHFVQIGREMLDAHLVPSAYDAAFEKRERAFYGIGVNISDRIDRLVADRLMGSFMLALQ